MVLLLLVGNTAPKQLEATAFKKLGGAAPKRLGTTVLKHLEITALKRLEIKAFKKLGTSIQNAGYGCTQTAGGYSIQTAEIYSTQTAGYSSTQKAGNNSIQTVGYGGVQTAGYGSIQKAENNSTQKAGGYSTQTAGSYSKQEAGHASTQTAGDCSTQSVTGGKSVCVRQGLSFTEVLLPKEGDVIQWCPYLIKGHLINGLKNGVPHIIVDGILSKIIHQRGDVYKVVNYGETEVTWIVKSGGVYSHGKTLKEACDDLLYKTSNQDKSAYKNLKLDDELSFKDAIKMYRTITGACSQGTRYFVEQNEDKIKESFKVSEIVEITRGQYGHNVLVEFLGV
jgi:hypothetical protein